MPARAVVLERLSKFTGEGHDLLRPGDYTQLTGRAGRRGIDDAGTAVVLFDHQVPFDRVASIAAAGAHPLASSFQPPYNMAVNLVANYDRKRAEELLAASFAQFRAERRGTELAARADVMRREIAELRAAAESSLGDIWEYAATDGGADTKSILRDFVQVTEPGDVFLLSADRADRWVLLARGYGINPRLVLVDESGEVRRLAADTLATTVARIGTLPLPEPIRSRETRYQRHVARLLRDFEASGDESTPGVAAAASPLAADPALTEKLATVKKVRRKERELAKMERRRETVSTGLIDAFHRRMRLLQERGYAKGWDLTRRGDRLRFVYNELDLLLAECVDKGLLAGLGAAELAAVVSLFTYEPRLADAVGDWPSALVADRGKAIFEVGDELAAAESRHGIEPARGPDPGFAAVVFDWTEGASLEEIFADDEVGAGDFVRNMRQLLDLLRQLRDAYPELAPIARLALRQIDRGVVAAGGQV